ncbi:rab-GTPase-TBC domain-containing protein [Aspergillus ambiguus]|uniref:putative TBC domain protein n=1 Tax=Aspergillus ambiguus TaxID=176160 RepID=UPI003CCDCBF6
MGDERSASIIPVVMPDPESHLQPIAHEDPFATSAPVGIRSASVSAPVDSSFESDSKSIPTTLSSSYPGDNRSKSARQDGKLDSGLDLSSAMDVAHNPRLSQLDTTNSGASLRSRRSIPSIIVNDTGSGPGSRPASRPGSRPGSRWSERKFGLRPKRSAEFDRKADAPPPVPQIEAPFNGISLDIPTSSLDGLGPQSMRFSKRGSLIKDEQKQQLQLQLQQDEEEGQQQRQSLEQLQRKSSSTPPAPPPEEDISQAEQQSEKDTEKDTLHSSPVPPQEPSVTSTEALEPPPRHPKARASLRVRNSTIASRAISADEDMLSRRVRLMYEKGDENVTDSEVAQAMAIEEGVLWEETAPPSTETSRLSGLSVSGAESKSAVSSIDADSTANKRDTSELAGGIEYWQNIQAGDVDRYGFIRTPTSNLIEGIEQSPIQRVSTSLLLAAETPRRKHIIRPPSALASNRSFAGRSPTRKMSEQSMRPSSSQSTYSATLRRSTSRFRQATNFLPHNRDRRFKDEAADMLTLPEDLDKIDTPAARAAKRKEWEREDKWTKMAKPTKKSKDGGGMTFEFDTHSSKLIERTWKGIPDRWRATAWYSFLEASAKRRNNSPPEEDLIEAFHEFQLVSSPDDVQIDIDVPRTITSHIMFRRRYRGGQRLLFRVLHAMSLYFPDTGYVQGMAALAATLLAYYDEEHAFIMLVRLWQVRGLERLYQSGFSGLMEALGDFENDWLAGGEVAAKLNELGIPPTAYGTRWYLTLFNYSIPFPAQLRVWDVFMLLGDPLDFHLNGKSVDPEAPMSTFGKGFDVLHATSAALIDGMREIILESDFENAMKVLTSWVPIRDVELFMRVAKAEWKVHRRKKFHKD